MDPYSILWLLIVICGGGYKELITIIPSMGSLITSLPLARNVFVMVILNRDCHVVHLLICSTG
jgi:hypothetical protein